MDAEALITVVEIVISLAAMAPTAGAVGVLLLAFLVVKFN